MEEESLSIKGVHFSYGDKFIKKFGYHRPSTQGGYIKKDGQYLKIGYISTEKGYVIVKIRKENKRIFYNKKYRKLSNDKFPVFCILDSYTIIRN